MKKALSLFIALVLVLGVIPLVVFANDTKTADANGVTATLRIATQGVTASGGTTASAGVTGTVEVTLSGTATEKGTFSLGVTPTASSGVTANDIDEDIIVEKDATSFSGSPFSVTFTKTVNSTLVTANDFNLTFTFVEDTSGGVTDIPVTGVSMSPTYDRIPVGEARYLNASVQPLDATNAKVIWSSSNTSVATVVENGSYGTASTAIVTGVSAGTTTITVKTEDGNFTATQNITVFEPALEFEEIVFDSMPAGYARPAAKSIVIKNLTSSDIDLTDVAYDGISYFPHLDEQGNMIFDEFGAPVYDEYDAFEFVINSDRTVPANGTLTIGTVQPKTGLAALDDPYFGWIDVADNNGYWYGTYTKFEVTPYVAPPTSGGSGGGSSSGGGGGGGSSKQDGSTTGSSSANNPSNPSRPSSNVSANGSVSSSAVKSELQSALRNTGASGTAKVTVKNAESISSSTLKSLAADAQKAGKSVVINADTTDANGNVQGRLYVEPAKLTGLSSDLKLGVYTDPAKTAAVKNTFEKYFSNNVAVVKCEQQGSFGASLKMAVKLDLSKLDTSSLVFYSHDPKTNTFSQIPNTDYTIDKNGYLIFTTEKANNIIITDAPLTRK